MELIGFIATFIVGVVVGAFTWALLTVAEEEEEDETMYDNEDI